MGARDVGQITVRHIDAQYGKIHSYTNLLNHTQDAAKVSIVLYANKYSLVNLLIIS